MLTRSKSKIQKTPYREARELFTPDEIGKVLGITKQTSHEEIKRLVCPTREQQDQDLLNDIRPSISENSLKEINFGSYSTVTIDDVILNKVLYGTDELKKELEAFGNKNMLFESKKCKGKHHFVGLSHTDRGLGVWSLEFENGNLKNFLRATITYYF